MACISVVYLSSVAIYVYLSSVAFSYFGSNARKTPKIPTHTRATKYLQPEVSPPYGCMTARTECTQHARTTRACSEHATHRTWPQCNRGLPAMTNEQRLVSSPRPVAFLHRGAGNETMLLSLSFKGTGPCILSWSLCCSPTIFDEVRSVGSNGQIAYFTYRGTPKLFCSPLSQSSLVLALILT